MKLSENNKKKWEQYIGWGIGKPNGLECDKCGAELLDTFCEDISTGPPPTAVVHCPECSFKGKRLL